MVHLGTGLSPPVRQSFRLSPGRHRGGATAFSRTQVHQRMVESFRLEKTLKDINVLVKCNI